MYLTRCVVPLHFVDRRAARPGHRWRTHKAEGKRTEVGAGGVSIGWGEEGLVWWLRDASCAARRRDHAAQHAKTTACTAAPHHHPLSPAAFTKVRKGGAKNWCCQVIEGEDWGWRVGNVPSRDDLKSTRCPPSQCLCTRTCPPRAHPHRPVLLSMRPSAQPPSTRTPISSVWPSRCTSTTVIFRAHVLPYSVVSLYV